MKYLYNHKVDSKLNILRQKSRKYLIGGVSAAMLFSGLAVPALAYAKSSPKAFGNIGYTAYSTMQRNAKFNVHEDSDKCALGWNVNGTYKFSYQYAGGPYLHDAVITNQLGHSFSIAGGYPAGSPHTYGWSGSGTVVNNAITTSVDYTVGAAGTHMNMTGVIAPNGTMSGTWTDNNGGGTRTGTWASTTGAAVRTVKGCRGDGDFKYSDANGDWYKVEVRYVKVSGNDTWFAGPVKSGSTGAGNWLFAKVHDGGTPGSAGDLISGSFVAKEAAKIGVASMSNPNDGPFAVTSGNLVVHN